MAEQAVRYLVEQCFHGGRLFDERLVFPEGVDQTIDGDDLVRAQEQGRQQCLLLGSAQIDLPPVLEHLEARRGEASSIRAREIQGSR